MVNRAFSIYLFIYYNFLSFMLGLSNKSRRCDKIIMTNDKYKACQDEGLVVVVKK